MEHLQHILALASALTATVATFVQRRTAKKKSAHHETLWRSEQEGTLRTVLESDIAHFKKVGLWWYVLFWGAVSATLAEVLDYLAFVSP